MFQSDHLATRFIAASFALVILISAASTTALPLSSSTPPRSLGQSGREGRYGIVFNEHDPIPRKESHLHEETRTWDEEQRVGNLFKRSTSQSSGKGSQEEGAKFKKGFIPSTSTQDDTTGSQTSPLKDVSIPGPSRRRRSVKYPHLWEVAGMLPMDHKARIGAIKIEEATEQSDSLLQARIQGKEEPLLLDLSKRPVQRVRRRNKEGSKSYYFKKKEEAEAQGPAALKAYKEKFRLRHVEQSSKLDPDMRRQQFRYRNLVENVEKVKARKTNAEAAKEKEEQVQSAARVVSRKSKDKSRLRSMNEKGIISEDSANTSQTYLRGKEPVSEKKILNIDLNQEAPSDSSEDADNEIGKRNNPSEEGEETLIKRSGTPENIDSAFSEHASDIASSSKPDTKPRRFKNLHLWELARSLPSDRKSRTGAIKIVRYDAGKGVYITELEQGQVKLEIPASVESSGPKKKTQYQRKLEEEKAKGQEFVDAFREKSRQKTSAVWKSIEENDRRLITRNKYLSLKARLAKLKEENPKAGEKEELRLRERRKGYQQKSNLKRKKEKQAMKSKTDEEEKKVLDFDLNLEPRLETSEEEANWFHGQGSDFGE